MARIETSATGNPHSGGLPRQNKDLPIRELSARANPKRIRLAFIVSHPIQYYAPLHQRLARRDDLEIKVFFTWHAAVSPVRDPGFQRLVEWDIPLTDGYAFESVTNTAADPGTHHFFGLRNPMLVDRVLAWSPDVVHVTGWAWYSHLVALRTFTKKGIPTFFRGDSHLLGLSTKGPRWWLKRALLRHIFSWPTKFLVVGSANRAYYETFGVGIDRLSACTHSIDVRRFADHADEFECEAMTWRQHLNIEGDRCVILFAGKFERQKRPIELMRAVQALDISKCLLIMVGNGELEAEVHAIATADPDRFRVLPFQNQSRMPVVYRLADLFVLPSACETWGLAMNEAIACGRAVLVSDRVGGAADVVNESFGRVFAAGEPDELIRGLRELTEDRQNLRRMGSEAARVARAFDISETEAGLVKAVGSVCLL